MILVLHGEDTGSSYNRLQSYLANFEKFQKVRLTDKNSKEDLINAVLTKDIFDLEKIIICENFLSGQKLEKKVFEKIPKEINLIFWEQKEIAPITLTKIGKFARVEIFKEKPQIFWFLDALSPSLGKTLVALGNLENPNTLNLIYHLANRMMILILTKMQISKESAQKIIERPLAPWQWEKLQNQARLFNLPTLHKLYSGSLKIDQMIKSGSTSLSPEILLSTLFVKYLA